MDPIQLTDITFGRTTGLAEDLDGNFKSLKTGVEGMADILRNAVLRLHGEGREIGCDMAAGAGLWCSVGAGSEDAHWINGERYTLDGNAVTVLLNPNSTTHVYMTLDNGASKLVGRPTKVIPSDVGEWYVGVAVTNGTVCTSVDDTDAETVNADNVASRLQAIAAWQEEVETAIGANYFGETPPSASVDTRLTRIESGGGPEDAILWGALEKSGGDPTKISQEIDADITSHETRMHGAVVDDGSDKIEYVIQEYDVISANVARGFLMLCRTVCPMLFTYMTDCIGLVWHVSGDGTDEFDVVDWVNSTWVVAPA